MRALLLIADIGGYTRFMRLHKLSLAHAQDSTAKLLEATIDAAPRLRLVAIEGDAAFLYVSEPEDEEVAGSIASVAQTMHRAFHVEQERIGSLTLCPCDACHQIGRLTVKVVAHLGDVVEQSVRGITTLAGTDVILVHRMLKNSVPVSEYVLVTEPIRERAGDAASAMVPLEEELEGLGRQRLYYLEIQPVEEIVTSSGGIPSRLALTGGQVARAVPYLLGIKGERR